jgi:hypothetical protein
MTDVVRIVLGPLVWLAGFSAVYALHGFVCAHEWGQVTAGGMSLLRLVLSAAAITAVGLQTGILIALYSRRYSSASGFVRRVSIMTGWVGLVAAVWTLMPVAVSSSCTL